MFDSEVLNIVMERVSGREGTALDWFSSDLSDGVQVAGVTDTQSLTSTSNTKCLHLTARKLEQHLAHTGPFYLFVPLQVLISDPTDP